MLDLYKLHIFTLVVQAGSFSGAAEQLLLSQSAVSQHIQQLEGTYGTKLFERGRRGVSLTAEGNLLHDYAQRILRLAAEAESAITDVRHLASGQLAIGVTPGISAYLLPEMVQQFRASLPHINVTLHTDITAHILAALHSGRFDVGFIEGELDGAEWARLEVIPWRDVAQVVVVGRKHAWWGQSQLTLAELSQQAMVMRQPASQTRKWLDEALTEAGVRPLITAEFDNVESIKRAVILGNCITILPPYAVEQELTLGQLQAIPLANDPLTRQLKLLWPKQGVLSAVAKAFIQQVVGEGGGVKSEK